MILAPKKMTLKRSIDTSQNNLLSEKKLESHFSVGGGAGSPGNALSKIQVYQ